MVWCVMPLRRVWFVLAISPLWACASSDDDPSLFGEPTTGATGTTSGPPSITTVASTIDPGMSGPPPGEGSGSTAPDDDTSGSSTMGVSASATETDTTGTGETATTGTGGSGDSSSTGAPDTSTTDGSSTGGSSSSDGGTTSGSSGSSGGSGGSTTGGCVPSGAGNYADCLAEDQTISNAVCANAAATCIVNDVANPFIGACAVQNCVDACGCPPHPGTGTAPVTCEDLTGDALPECWLDCSGGDTCPDGMQCWADTLCLWPNMSDGTTPYDDCVNNPNSVCGLDGLCIVDNVMTPSIGVCSDPCTNVADCPAAPPTGTAPVTCTNLIGGNPDSECILSCSLGQTCPNGMSCFSNNFCAWDAV